MSVKSTLRMLRRLTLRLFLAVIALFFLLMTALFVLFSSSQGNSWLLTAINRVEPRFSATLEGGRLLGQASVRNLRWSSPGIDILIPHLEWRWDWQCLAERRLCLDQVRAQGGRVVLTENPDVVPAGDGRSTFSPFRLLFAIEVRNIQLQQTKVDLFGSDIALADLQMTARIDASGLQISPLRMRDLQVAIAAPENAGAPSPAPFVLPTIKMPLALQLDGLDLAEACIRVGGAEYLVHHLQLSGEARGAEVEISKFEISTPEASLQAQAQVRLTANYPLSMYIQGRLLALPSVGGLEVQVSATGSIAELVVELTTIGAVTGHVKVNANLLDPVLPFSAAISWQNFNWPILQPTLFSKDGQVAISGTTAGYSFQLSGDAGGEQLPEMSIAAHGQGDSKQLTLDSLTMAALEGTSELTGSLRWGEEVFWKGLLSFQQINPAELVAALPGHLSGRLDYDFLWRNGHWDVHVGQLEIDGVLAGQPLRVSGAVQGNQAGDWQFTQLQMHSGDSRLEVNGRIGGDSNLHGELVIVNLQTSIPNATGAAKGEFSFSGGREALQLKFFLAGEALGYAGHRIESFDAKGQLTLAAMPQGSVHIQSEGMTYKDFSFKHLDAVYTGDSNNHRLSFDLLGEKLSMHSTFKGMFAEQLWTGQLLESWLETPVGRWNLDAPLDINYDPAQKRLGIAAHCWHSGDAALCLNEEAQVGSNGRLNITLQDLAGSQLGGGVMPEGLVWHGNLAAKAVANWAPDRRPRIKADFSAGSGWFEIGQTGQKLQADYQQLEMSAELDEKSAQVKLRLGSDQLGRVDINLQIDLFQEGKPLQGEFHFSDLQLDILRPLINPLEEISGTVTADGKVSGLLKKPQVFGAVALVDGRIGGAALPADIEKINLQLTLDGNQVNLNGNLMFGEGRGELAGTVNWQQTPATGWLTLRGRRQKFSIEPELNLLISPDLRLELLPEQLALTGKILVPYGRIKVKNLPKGAVRLSDDVVVLDNPNASRGKEAFPIYLALEITLLEDVKIEAFGLKANLEGSMAIKQVDNQPLVGNGRIDLHKGTYRAFGQNLLINKGELLFFGPLSKPFINVDAIRNPQSTSDNVTAGIRLQGEAHNPKITIYSEPAMSQQEAISYLLRGRSLGAGSGSSKDTMVATMLIGAGIGRSEGTISDVGTVFGVKDLAVDTRGEGSDTKVQVSGYVLPGVQVGYGVGIFSPVTEITMRYEIVPKLVLEAVRGLQSAIDILYEFEF